MATSVRLACPISVRGGGRDLDEAGLGGRRPRVAFALLVVNAGRAVPHETVAEALWGPSDLPSAEASLREVLSRLRTALTGTALADRVVSGRGWYRLDLPDDAQVDLTVAARTVAEAAHACQVGDWQRAVELARASLATTTAPFLPGETSDWVVGVRGSLDAEAARALHMGVDASIRAGRGAEAVRWAEQLVSRLPLSERAHLALMRARQADGDRGGALRIFDRCRQLLEDELGVEPGTELRELYLTLLADEAPARRSGSAHLGAAEAGPTDAVVVPATLPFVDSAGRLTRLLSVWDRVADGPGRLVLLTGAAGSGRTRLCAELARRLPPGTVSYGRQDREGGPPLQALREALRVPDGGGPETPTQWTAALAGLAAQGPRVVVLDDLQWADRQLWHLLRQAARHLPRLGPLVLVLSIRGPDRRARLELAPVYRDVPVLEIRLSPLSDADLAAVVFRRWPGVPAALRERAVGRLSVRTAGLPFLVSLLLDEVGAEGRELADDVLSTCVPPGVVAAAEERLSDLGVQARTVAESASVSGALFDARSLTARADLDEATVAAQLDELIEVGMLVPVEPAGYCFAEPLMRTAVARTLAGSRSGARRTANESPVPVPRTANSPPTRAP